MYKSDPIEDSYSDHEITELDEQWQRQQPRFAIPGRNGRMWHSSSVTLALLTAILPCLAGAFIVFGPQVVPSDELDRPNGFCVLAGITMLSFGLCYGVYALLQAVNYRNARQEYLARRQELSDRHYA